MKIAIPLLNFDGKEVKNIPLIYQLGKKLKFILNEFKENNLNLNFYEDHFLVQG